MSEKKLTLKIFGQVLNLKSDADPEYAQKLADYVDISGGLETNIEKDLTKIKNFLLNIKNL